MKFALAFLGISFAFVANQVLFDLNNIEDALFEFLLRYQKSYGLLEGIQRRLEFENIFEMVLNHNRDHDKGLHGFKLKTNRFADLFDSERESLSTGNRLPPYNFAEFSIQGKSIRTVNNTICPRGPDFFDWRKKHCVTPVKDQGYSCRVSWAFSSVAALESHWCIKTGDLISLSEQQLVDCNRHANTGSWGCDGGNQASAYMYVIGNGGIQNESSYPYQEGVPHSRVYPCRYNRENKVAIATGYWRISPFNATLIRDIVSCKGPVVATMYASLNSFYFYASGIYDDKRCKEGSSHSVLIVGYGRQNGIDYWLCKNSWSTDWGDNGYFKIESGVNRCGIESYLIYPDVY